MSKKNSLSLFDQLSTEIILDIFDYLSSNDIIYTFFHLNQRFSSVVLQYLRFINYFTTSTNHFSFWQTMLPTISSQIKCLTITTPDFSFSLDLFPNLKSLIIFSSLPIYHDELTVILESEQFKKLNSFKIKSDIVNKSDRYEVLSFHKILHDENSLHLFESLPELYTSSTNVNNLKISVNLRSLSLKLSVFNSVVSLLNYTPNLKYLNLRSLILFPKHQANPNIDLSQIKLKNFSFVLQSNEISKTNFPVLTWFIKQFSSSLVYLSLTFNKISTHEFQFNGFTLQQQLLESMIQLKSFHLYTQLESYNSLLQLNKEPLDAESLLSTFQTQFWFDHHWTFGTHGTYLYTLPFHFDKLKDFIDFDQIKSSNSVILNSPTTWSHVKSIDSTKFSKVSSNLIKQMKLKMPDLTSITFTGQLMNSLYTNDGETNETDIILNSITTVRCVGENLQTIKQWLNKIFPNTRHLILSYGSYPTTVSSNRMAVSQNFDEYFRGTDCIYSSKVQYVQIKLTFKDLDPLYEDVIYLVKELLEMFKNLRSFIFHFDQMRDFPHMDPFTDLSKMIELLNMKNISEIYQIKHIYNYLQFVRKNNE